MERITEAILLTPDRTAVLLSHASLAAVCAGPIQFRDDSENGPSATFKVYTALADSEVVQVRTWLRVTYVDDSTGATRLEGWRVLRRVADYGPANETDIVLRPGWLDMADEVLVPVIGGVEDGPQDAPGLSTLRLLLVNRSLPESLAIVFSPENGAPAASGGAPLFILGSVDTDIADTFTDVSLVAVTPLQALESICADAKCVWRARLVASGDNYSTEVYEVDLVTPEATLPADVLSSLASKAATVGSIIIGNGEDAAPHPSATDLRLTDDVRDLFTGSVPICGDSGSPVTIDRAQWIKTGLAVNQGANFYTLRLSDPQYRHDGTGKPLVVPYDGWGIGWRLLRFETGDSYTITATSAPDLVTVYTAGSNPDVWGSGPLGFLQTNGLPATAIVNEPAVAQYGRIIRTKEYPGISPYPNLFRQAGDPFCGTLRTTDGPQVPSGTFYEFGAGSGTHDTRLVSDEGDVSVGTHSCEVTLGAEGHGIYHDYSPVSFGFPQDRMMWCSLRVKTGSLRVTVGDFNGPVETLIVEPTQTLKVLEMGVFEGSYTPSLYRVQWIANEPGTVFVLDGISITPSRTAYPPRQRMGPATLWGDAWADMLQSETRVTSVDTEFFDVGAMAGGSDIRVGDFARVAADGRGVITVQVLEMEWAHDLWGDTGATTKLARLGPPPASLVDRLSQTASKTTDAPGSKLNVTGYGSIVARGLDTSGARDVLTAECEGGPSFTRGTRVLQFLDADTLEPREYIVDTIDVAPEAADTIFTRRVPGNDLALILKVQDPDDILPD